ncbi:MAG TPA: hypothetical protein VII77_09160 [Candidatus Deferrimicrobium sp.]
MTRYATGVFYHPSFSRRSYLTAGARLADFPMALDGILRDERVKLYEPGPVSRELVLKVHTPELIEGVKGDPLCSTAWHSAGGVVMAGEKIAEGEIGNAFAFIGAGGHHSGRDFFGGYCCFNDAYFDRVAHQFSDRVRRFRPDLLFWYFGFDTHQGDYGDIGLTGPCYWNIALLMRDLAEEVCGGKLAVVLGGGSETKLATYLIPPVIERLAGVYGLR